MAKKHFGVVAGGLVLGMLLFNPAFGSKAYAGGQSDAASGTAASGGKISIIMQQPDLNDGTYAQFAAFEKKTGIKIEIEQLPNDQFHNLVTARAATNDLGDMVAYHVGALFRALNPEKNFVDVTNEPYMKNLDEQYLSTVAVDGKVYGPPVLPVNAGGVIYNTKIYKQLGLKVPATWKELMDNCQAIKDKGINPVVGTFQVVSTSQMIWLSDFYNVAAQIPSFAADYTANKLRLVNVPPYVRSFEKMVEVYKRGFYNKDYLSTSRDAGLTMLAKGEAAHYFGLTREIGNIARNTPELVNDIGFFAQPSDDPKINGMTIWMPHAYYIAKTTKNLEKAKLFQEYMSSPEAAAVYAERMVPTGPFLIKNVKLPDTIYPAIKSAVSYVNSGKTSAAQEFVSPVKGPNVPQICMEASTGGKTALETVAAIDEDNKKYAKQLGLPGW